MKVLVVDDDHLIANLIVQNLELEGYETIVAYDGEQAVDLAKKHVPDLVTLDIMMPKKDGYHVCRELQDLGAAVIILTAKNDISDKLIGLELGADDYLTKPFDSRELIARIKAIFRRLEKGKQKGEIKSPQGNGIMIMEKSRRVQINAEELKLTPKEYNLLLLFYRNPEMVFSREQLLDKIWGYDFFGDSRTVDIHVQRLRKKLGYYGNCIETVFGVGYRYREVKNEIKE